MLGWEITGGLGVKLGGDRIWAKAGLQLGKANSEATTFPGEQISALWRRAVSLGNLPAPQGGWQL